MTLCRTRHRPAAMNIFSVKMWKELREKQNRCTNLPSCSCNRTKKMPKLSAKHISTLFGKILKGNYKCKTGGKLDKLLEICDIVERTSRTNLKSLCKHSILIT